MAFSKDGSFCVTSGQRFVKYWYFDNDGDLPGIKEYQSKGSIQVLRGRSGILADLCDCTFRDAACTRTADGIEYTYLVTNTGILCLLTRDRLLNRRADMQVPSANCIDVCQDYVICGGADGIVR